MIDLNDPSYAYWPQGFRLVACEGLVVADRLPTDDDVRLGVPSHAGGYFQNFLQESGGTLTLQYRKPKASAAIREDVLGKTPTQYRVVFDRGQVPSWPAYGFFYQDQRKTFFVTQRSETAWRPPPYIKADGPMFDARAAAADWATPSGVTPLPTPPTPPPLPRRFRTPKSATSKFAGTVAKTGLAPGVAPWAAEPITAKLSISYRSTDGTELAYVVGGSTTGRPLAFDRLATVPSPEIVAPPSKDVALKNPNVDRYLFEPFYHPYVCALINQLQRYGLDGLLDPSPTGDKPGLRRQQEHSIPFLFDSMYEPGDAVAYPYPSDRFDFSSTGAYSIYNWEIFFHAPLLIAQRLVTDQRYEQALRWFHVVFHPMERAVPSEPFPRRVWKFGPFFDATVPDSPENLLKLLTYSGNDPSLVKAQKDVEVQIAQWRTHPFQPHRIARFRVGAYQRYVVMKYVEALIGWGDQLFRRDTAESINEAAQYYVLALQILGRRPERVAKTSVPTPWTFNTLLASPPTGPGPDPLSKALIEIETLTAGSPSPTAASGETPAVGASLAFCLPPNEKLLGYWDLVEDRLFKIRHCMNIEGVVRTLPLFEPPIDPALLVRAAAAGLDLASILDDLSAPPPIRRFRVLVQKAQELCGEVRSLGGALLGALEKRDAEELAQIRATQERNVLTAARETRKAQIEEAKTSLTALQRSREAAEKRFNHYSSLQPVISAEREQQTNTEMANQFALAAQVANAEGAALALIPQVHASPTCGGTESGGQQFHNLYGAIAAVYGAIGTAYQFDAVRAGNRALTARRVEEWTLQKDLAAKDMEQIDRQILAQEIRIAIAEHELLVHDRQVENARETDEFVRGKYSNKELYDWMVSQLASVHHEMYKLAFSVARQAEKAFQFERAEPSRSFVNFGAWESLRRGLLAGERLSLDLRKMEVAFLNEDRRDLELLRHISLSQLDPLALVLLREKGICEIQLPESLFDADTPGHYLRRIRSLSISIPSVTGPYVPVRCTVTLLSSEVRTSPSTASTAKVRSDVSIQSIVTSHAREDAGLFEVDPRDDRYLPFEGAGVIATLRLELPDRFRAFDYETIQDVMLHLRYTARDGRGAADGVGTTFAQKVLTGLETTTPPGPLAFMVSLKQEFPDAWHRLLNLGSTGTADFDVPLTPDRFPFAYPSEELTINGAAIVGIVDDPALYPGTIGDPPTSGADLAITVTPPGTSTPLTSFALSKVPGVGGQPYGVVPAFSSAPGTLKVSIPYASINALGSPATLIGTTKLLNGDFVRDLILIVNYRLGT